VYAKILMADVKPCESGPVKSYNVGAVNDFE